MIPKGTKLHCTHCGKVISEFIKDLPNCEEVRNVRQYLKKSHTLIGVVDRFAFDMQCKGCEGVFNLYNLIMEELCREKP